MQCEVAENTVGRDPSISFRPGSSNLLLSLLAEQSDLTAVERFARQHDSSAIPAQSRYYRSLLPQTPPEPRQQYAFEVDLDRCSGCKACVTACHNLNGLDETEAWRDVGMLVGGTASLPVIQHVTTACHHCLNPACYRACPVDAYEKDPITGIVRHLDDQCFGCQYCTLACPYDVPKYHPGKGIVRKCDMCSSRLAVGEAPACVQACPHEAIRIQLVDRQQVIDDSESNAFLPGAPQPDYTLPTTTFKTARPLPRNLLPADYYQVHPEHAHWPLVIMLVLTQLSVGAFLVELIQRVQGTQTPESPVLHSLFSLSWGLLALGASTLHLGRPHLAFRAVIGLRHSWLSREIVAFGMFAPLAILYAGLTWFQPEFYTCSLSFPLLLEGTVVAAGLLGIVCSMMIYIVVRREFWSVPRTIVRFLGTMLILGLSATLLTSAISAEVSASALTDNASVHIPCDLALPLLSVTLAKLILEGTTLLHLRDTHFTAMRRTAVLMTTGLKHITLLRFGLAGAGGVLIPTLMLSLSDESSRFQLSTWAGLGFALLLGGELAERTLYFAAVIRQKMPGGLTI